MNEFEESQLKTVKIFFDQAKTFSRNNINPLIGITGLYFIFLSNTEISYPFSKSRLIYIGMSEKKTNSIGNRLAGHYDGQSGNVGLLNYRKVEELKFTFLDFQMLKRVWEYRIEDLESYFILDFVTNYGVYPICNNKSGFEILNNQNKIQLQIDWKYFERP